MNWRVHWLRNENLDEIERLRRELADERAFREFYQALATKRLLQLEGVKNECGQRNNCGFARGHRLR